jgi:hypothetical protein
MVLPDYNETPEGIDLPFNMKLDIAVALVLLILWFFFIYRKKVKKKNKQRRNEDGEIRTRITLQELRSCKGFEGISEQEGEETIDTLQHMSVLFFELFMQKKANRKWKIKG